MPTLDNLGRQRDFTRQMLAGTLAPQQNQNALTGLARVLSTAMLNKRLGGIDEQEQQLRQKKSDELSRILSAGQGEDFVQAEGGGIGMGPPAPTQGGRDQLIQAMSQSQMPEFQTMALENMMRQGGGVNDPAQLRYFESMTEGMSPEDVEQARRVALGLEGRASSAGFGFEKVMGPDGREYFVRTDPRGGAVTPTDLASPTIQEQEFEKELGKGRGQNVAGKEASIGQAYTSSLYSMSQTGEAADTARILLEHPGLDAAVGFGGETTSKVPGTPAADAKALLDQLRNRTFISALQAMREASKTGGAVGQVSEAEGQRMENAFVSLSQAQSPEQFRQELKNFIRIMEEGQQRVRNAFKEQYGSTEGFDRLFGQLPGAGEPTARMPENGGWSIEEVD